MKLKNYQEDLVLNMIDIILDDHPEMKNDKSFIFDVAAYTLNRLPPKYIMGERGFTRFASSHLADSENGETMINFIEPIIIINRAIDIVKNRRKNGKSTSINQSADLFITETIGETYFHNFPHFIGRVLDSETHQPVNDALITLYINGDKALPCEEGWLNPYFTHNATKGFFSFWPKALESTNPKIKFKTRIAIEHPEYQNYSVERGIETKGSFFVHDYIQKDAIIHLDNCYLSKKK